MCLGLGFRVSRVQGLFIISFSRTYSNKITKWAGFRGLRAEDMISTGIHKTVGTYRISTDNTLYFLNQNAKLVI